MVGRRLARRAVGRGGTAAAIDSRPFGTYLKVKLETVGIAWSMSAWKRAGSGQIDGDRN